MVWEHDLDLWDIQRASSINLITWVYIYIHKWITVWALDQNLIAQNNMSYFPSFSFSFCPIHPPRPGFHRPKRGRGGGNGIVFWAAGSPKRKAFHAPLKHESGYIYIILGRWVLPILSPTALIIRPKDIWLSNFYKLKFYKSYILRYISTWSLVQVHSDKYKSFILNI